MVKKKKKEYLSKPSVKKLQSAYKKAGSPEVAKELSKNYESKVKAYEKQRAKILSGDMPSRTQANLTKIGNTFSSILSKPMLKKPQAKLPSYSAQKIISRIASEQGGLVTERDPLRERYENPEIDNRSLFFQEEYRKQKQKRFGGFI